MAVALTPEGPGRATQRTRRGLAGAALVLSVCCPGLAAASDTGASGFSAQKALAISQAAVGNGLPDVTLIRASGEPLHVAQLRGKPLLVSLIFTSCYHTCPTITRQLDAAVAVARDVLGPDAFNVATIGFDTEVDTPAMMAAFRDKYGVVADDWYFLSGDAATIAAVSDATGFIFFASPRGFDHLSQTTLIDAAGRVVEQIYGIPSPTMVVEPLKALIWEQRRSGLNLAEVLRTVKLFCTVYDPTTGRYRLDYSLLITILVGGLCLGAVATFLVHAWRGSTPPRAG